MKTIISREELEKHRNKTFNDCKDFYNVAKKMAPLKRVGIYSLVMTLRAMDDVYRLVQTGVNPNDITVSPFREKLSVSFPKFCVPIVAMLEHTPTVQDAYELRKLINSSCFKKNDKEQDTQPPFPEEEIMKEEATTAEESPARETDDEIQRLSDILEKGKEEEDVPVFHVSGTPQKIVMSVDAIIDIINTHIEILRGRGYVCRFVCTKSI